jgi:glucose-1-phosphate adenylyltransferase
VVGEGTVIRDSIIMNSTEIGRNCELYKAIVAEDSVLGDNVKLGIGEEVPNETDPNIYNHGLVTIGEKSVIPKDVSIGKNTVVFGVTSAEDYKEGYLPSGRTLIKAGEEQ